MANLANQSITDGQKQMLEVVSKATGNSIASIVRDILQREHLKYMKEGFEALEQAIDNEVV